MIPVWTEPTSTKEIWGNVTEKCVFCDKPTRTWHENSNSPICVGCAETHKVSDILLDHGHNIRKAKRLGTFNREDSVRAN